MVRITDEQLDSLGDAYTEMVDKKEIQIAETPFYKFVELYLENTDVSCRKCVVLCR